MLLLAHGGPNSLDDIEPFLTNIRGGRPFPAALLDEVRERYHLIGGRSPLLEISRRQALALQRELNSDGKGYRVYLGMRNWHPFIRDTLREIERDGVERLIAVCLAPQNSKKSVGLYFQHLRAAQEDLGWKVPTQFVESWHDESLLIDAFAEKLREALAAFAAQGVTQPAIVFTAHSLPEKVVAEGDPYDREVRQTAAAVAARCDIHDWLFAYQSQGATDDNWLGPTVESVLDSLSQRGAGHALISPIGFVADHVEILYDIDILFHRYAGDRNIVLRRTASLNDSPTLVRALAATVRRNLAAPVSAGSR